MTTDLSPENELFIQSAIAGGVFHDRREALDEAVQLLKRRQQLLQYIDEGTRQLRSGEFTDYDDTSLKERFDQLERRTLQRIEANERAR